MTINSALRISAITVNASMIYELVGGGVTSTFGTASTAATITNNGTIRFSGNVGLFSIASYIKGYDDSHKVALTGTEPDWDYGGVGSYVALGYVDIQFNIIAF